MGTRIQTLEEFVARDPGDSFSRYALALELEKAGQELESVAHLREVILRDPSYIAAFYHLGRLLARQGKIDDARAIYNQGLNAGKTAGDERTRSEIQQALEMLDDA
jgi:tetratricopeptide (TPR) repeat protein